MSRDWLVVAAALGVAAGVALGHRMGVSEGRQAEMVRRAMMTPACSTAGDLRDLADSLAAQHAAVTWACWDAALDAVETLRRPVEDLSATMGRAHFYTPDGLGAGLQVRSAESVGPP